MDYAAPQNSILHSTGYSYSKNQSFSASILVKGVLSLTYRERVQHTSVFFRVIIQINSETMLFQINKK
jgi:hypothetical protein